MPDYTRFIILSPSRSGSTFLMSYLRSHPQVRCFGEVLNLFPDHVDYGVEGYDNDNDEDRLLRETDATAFLRQRIFCTQPQGIQAVGFKPMYQHLPFYPGLTEWLAQQDDLLVLHSKRRNLLRLILSMRIAEKTGLWIDPQRARRGILFRAVRRVGRAVQLPSPFPPAARSMQRARSVFRTRKPQLAETKAVVLSPEQCQFGFGWLREQANEYAERFRGHPVLDVYYEDLVDATERTLRQVQDFLHLDPRPLTTATRRQNPEPLRALIVNYDELYEAFRGTEFATFFDD